MNRHHAFVIEAKAEEGIKAALAWTENELGMKVQCNPDVVVLRYGLFSVDDARRVCETAAQAPFTGEYKALIIAASRTFHEAQNALLKLFEEPPPNTYIFLVLPTLGGLLPTLRSRVQIINDFHVGPPRSYGIPEAAGEFMKASKEERSTLIKKLANGKDEEERRENRDEAIAIMDGIEAVAYRQRGDTFRFQQGVTSLLNDIAVLRGHLYDRSAPVKMILEHLSLVMPEGLSSKV